MQGNCGPEWLTRAVWQGWLCMVGDASLRWMSLLHAATDLHRCDVGQLRQLTTRVAHVLPVSDDGGSTAEIVRVLGGPAVGDIRSRCLRLADDTGDEVAPPTPTLHIPSTHVLLLQGC